MPNTFPRIPAAQTSIAGNSLESWRSKTLDQMIVLGISIAAPLDILDIISSLQHGRTNWAIFSMVSLGVIVLATAIRRYYWQRATIVLGIFFVYAVATLLNVGLVGAGRIHAVFLVVLAAALLPPRRAVILTASACLMVSLILGAQSLGLIPMSPTFTSRATEPATIIINMIVLILLMIATVQLILSLIARLTSSLNRAEAALAERDALNSRLEEMVATRTATLARQLALQRALAGCSRLLMSRGASIRDDYRATLTEALALILDAVGGDHISVAQYPSYEHGIEKLFHAFHSLAEVHKPGANQKQPPSIEVVADMPEALNVWKAGGGSFNGPVAGRFPEHARYMRYLDENSVQSTFIEALTIDDRPWGHILLIDYTQARTWDAAEVQTIRTAAEMIVTFTEGWSAATSLQEREGLLRSINDALPDGYLYQVVQFVDGSYDRYTYVSRGVERLLGVTPAQILADVDVLHNAVIPEDSARVAAIDRDSSARHSEFDVELRFFKADGSTGWFHIRSVPHMSLADGRMLWSGICLEITARKEAELALAAREAQLLHAKEAAEAADAAKTTFLANMSHEIRTPLNAVIGMADLLLNTDLSPQQRDFTATIGTAGQALLSLINDILDLSRIESGHLALDAQPFDLRGCLCEARDLVAHAANEKGLRLSCRIDPGVPPGVIGDSLRLRQVLLNLLSNAVKFTNSGEVALTAHATPLGDERHQLEITVRDTGIGISPEQHRQIFEPFVQADRSTARRYGGTGLGLAICCQIIELMGGQIRLTSAPDSGSAFTVSVPFRSAPPPAIPAAQPDDLSAATSRPLRILVAEDNPINQEVTRQMLARLGHAVTVVESGQAAIDAVVGTPFDVVLMDVQMPEMDGEEATRRIRSLDGSIRQPYIIALTANALPGDRDRLLGVGMDDYLSKPVRTSDLWRALAGTPTVSVEPIDRDMLNLFLDTLGPDRADSIAFVLQLFEQEVCRQIDTLDEAIRAADAALVRKEAHRQRGGYLQIGARDLAAFCRRLEQIDTTGDLAALSRDLRECYEQTLIALRTL